MPDSRTGTAAQANATVGQQPLRVLIADDDRDGAMTLAALLELEGYEVRPVLIAVTGWKQASDKILATLAGFDHHVAKPYEPAALISLLSKLRPAAR